jgi:hypothetical protein
VSLVVAGRYDVVSALTATNYDTLAPLDQPPLEAAEPPAAARARPPLIPALGLTDQQLALILTGMCMLQHQLQGVLQQRQQVLAQLAAPCSSNDSSSSCGSAASDADVMHGDDARAFARRAVAVGLSSSSSSEGGGTPTCSPGCAVMPAQGRHSATGSDGTRATGSTDPLWAALQAMRVREQQLTQLMVVLRKESMLHVLGMGLLVSSLSTLQLSKAVLLSWPHPFSLDELLPHATAAAHQPGEQLASQRGAKRHQQCAPSAAAAGQQTAWR